MLGFAVPHFVPVQLSFQTFSGMYESADSRVVLLFVVAQYAEGFVPSLNMVPPTPTV